MKKNIIFYLSFLFWSSITAQDNKLFTLLEPAYTGVTFSNNVEDLKDRNILLYSNYYGGGGVGIADFNNDGLQDLFFSGNLVGDEIYINKGNLKFENITQKAGILNNGGWSSGVALADVNGDGFIDIYVCRELYDDHPELRRNKLYINNGDLTFSEQATQFRIDNSERTRHATFFDYNNDGLLDLFLLNQPPNPGSYSKFFGINLKNDLRYASKLYKNVDNTHFVDVSEEAGVLRTSNANSVSTGDFNNDGYTDLYIANDFYLPDFFYINNQDGTFTNIADQALKHMSYFSMGVDAADIDNDGLLDIMVADMAAEDNVRLKSNMSGMDPKAFWKVVNNGGHYQYMYNTLQLNNGNGTYSEIAELANISSTDWSWANLIADFDNDGLKDIYVTNGLLRDIRNTDANAKMADYVVEVANTFVKENPNAGDVSIWDILDLKKTVEILPSEKLKNYAFKNNGDYTFSKVMTDWGLDQKTFSNGAAYADLDNDGDLEIIVNNINETAFIYKNNTIENTRQNFLRIALKDKNNKNTLGTKITIHYKNQKQFIETTNVRGIYSTSEQIVHFGLNTEEKINKVVVNWPNGKQTLLKNVETNQLITLFMNEAVSGEKEEEILNPIFKEITKLQKLTHRHIENNFNDYKNQVLLPHKLSQFGPALASVDVNNDNLLDVYIGAAAGKTASLYIQNTLGTFTEASQEAFKEDAISEDLDAVFFDVDNDGDQDLYVVSGGNEYKSSSQNYKDKLYKNDGTGVFRKVKELDIPSISGSVAVPGDFDNDGDLDVFVGGRLFPGAYPTPVSSYILENKKGVLVNSTQQIAPELIDVGMVTDAIWDDFDKDNDLDLIVVGEWMPITIFENVSGQLVKSKTIKNSSGWWFSIHKGDFDNDGDIDFIAGNLGLNYKYKTTVEKPFDIYYQDFDKNGLGDIVLGYYNSGKHYPLRGFSCSAQQVPKLKEEIKKYDLFASLELEEVYGNDNLKEALHYEVQTFATSYIENLGDGTFKLKALPNKAQFSSVNDILVKDFNNDNNLDVLIAGNLYVSEIETMRNDAGTGLLLYGKGDGSFISQSIQESGFFTNGDVKKLLWMDNEKEKWVIVANNNDKIQLFKFNEEHQAKNTIDK
ncbi:VCBS repeat-containing protein [Aquimarina sp. 2201CG5-10]|uniref:VCBS repeat-containing protein n=1 Tax=Aquimarina callyspongiae TaxID=3098150 RepID=UPI002AB57846|nr:VCBS repeat-containing protein [Aquimarina sp. 2201CG5-10]MDY8138400.1 VCBS repeat-containing protein [Aquimarina sp. 2201CG5-10]